MNIRPATLLLLDLPGQARRDVFIAGSTDDLLILELALGFALCKIPGTLAPDAKTQPLPELQICSLPSVES